MCCFYNTYHHIKFWCLSLISTFIKIGYFINKKKNALLWFIWILLLVPTSHVKSLSASLIFLLCFTTLEMKSISMWSFLHIAKYQFFIWHNVNWLMWIVKLCYYNVNSVDIIQISRSNLIFISYFWRYVVLMLSVVWMCPILEVVCLFYKNLINRFLTFWFSIVPTVKAIFTAWISDNIVMFHIL